MADIGTRPGGLTALAVINFIVAGFGLLAAAGALFTPKLADTMDKGIEQAERAETRRAETRRAAEAAAAASSASHTAVESGGATESRAGAPADDAAAASRRLEELAHAREAVRKMKETPYWIFIAASGVEAVIAILLLLSGIGYLKMRRMLGRTLGTVYALLAIAWAVVGVFWARKLSGQDFGLLNMIGFIYPALTLFLVRVTFKDDFVNP